MKKSIIGVLSVVITVFLPILVNAESTCSYSELAELNGIAANVKANYEETQVYAGQDYKLESSNNELIDIYNMGLKISILNMSNDIYIEIKDDTSNDIKRVNYADTTDGIYTFIQEDVSVMRNYTIEIYANKYSCNGELIRKIDFIVPYYNTFSQLEACTKYPEFSYCRKFLTTEQFTAEEFYSNLSSYQEKFNKKEDEKEKQKSFLGKISEFYHKNNVLINSIGIIIVISGVTSIVIIIKKRRSRVL